jgi:cyclopropane-fatty-acyl-phospholipid synthase
MSCVPSSQQKQTAHSVVGTTPLERLEDSAIEREPLPAGEDLGLEPISGGVYQKLLFNRLQHISQGCIVINDGSNSIQFGVPDSSGEIAKLFVHNRRFYKRIVWGGSLGAAESYIQGDWDSPDLLLLLQVLSKNAATLSKVDGVTARLLKPLRVGLNWLRRNTRSGSRKNIAAHYDLSNDFFSLMLDPNLTYSAAVFKRANMSLVDAQTEKYDRVCRKLNLRPNDRVLEIGTGWGGFALHAAQNYGCRVTTTTISAEQHRHAQAKFQQAGLQDRVTLLQQDYRDLQGQFDKLVSIEMIEAVGEKFLAGYFKKCCQLLKPNGAMCIQAITIPDHRYDAYRKSVDFIQKYIFPGGFLPSFRAITESLAKHTDFRFFHSEDFGPHYATTLEHWRENFWSAISQVHQMGFDRRFIRTWEYYLCYCQAGFAERLIGVSQIVFTKPMCRLAPIV